MKGRVALAQGLELLSELYRNAIIQCAARMAEDQRGLTRSRLGEMASTQ